MSRKLSSSAAYWNRRERMGTVKILADKNSQSRAKGGSAVPAKKICCLKEQNQNSINIAKNLPAGRTKKGCVSAKELGDGGDCFVARKNCKSNVLYLNEI